MLGVDLVLDFGSSGAGRACLGPGWRPRAADGVASTAVRASLTLDIPKPPSPDAWRLLELDLAPFLHPQEIPAQRIAVRANGTVIGNDAIETPGTTTLGYVLSPETLAGTPLTLEFRFPNAVPPAQIGKPGTRPRAFTLFRLRIVHLPPQTQPAQRRYPPACETQPASNQMSPAVRHAILNATQLSPDEFALKFESLGHNCKFGVVQLNWGGKPIGLLRFNAITLPALLDGLETGFAEADDPEQIQIQIFHTTRDEYFLVHPRYSFLMHTDRFADDMSEAAVRAEMLRSLTFMKRKFRETLETADRIFVFQRTSHTLASHMRPVLARLQAYGPNRLLFVTAEPQRRAGSMDDLGGGLLHGVVEPQSLEPPVDRFNLATWTSLCLNAVNANKK